MRGKGGTVEENGGQRRRRTVFALVLLQTVNAEESWRERYALGSQEKQESRQYFSVL